MVEHAAANAEARVNLGALGLVPALNHYQHQLQCHPVVIIIYIIYPLFTVTAITLEYATSVSRQHMICYAIISSLKITVLVV